MREFSEFDFDINDDDDFDLADGEKDSDHEDRVSAGSDEVVSKKTPNEKPVTKKVIKNIDKDLAVETDSKVESTSAKAESNFSEVTKPHEKRKLSRYKPGKIMAIVLATAAFICGVIIYFRGEDKNFAITHYQVVSDKVNSDVRVVFLSDLHEKEYGEDNSELIQSVSDLNPDLIIFGGDFITFPDGSDESMLSLFTKLVDVAPCYAVLGNHELEMIYGDVETNLAEKIEATGVTLLRNQNCTVEFNGNVINLVGLEGATDDYALYGQKETVESLTDDYEGFRICINHVPATVLQYMQDTPTDLVLSGHTHGGLMNLPIVGRLYTRDEGIFPKYAYGEYDLTSGAKLIIGGGLGDSHNVLRIGNPAEVVVVDISNV